MRTVAAAVLSLIVLLSCGKKFGVRDRYEGVKEDVLRVYVRAGNPQGYDDEEAAVHLAKVFSESGRTRADLLISSGGISVEQGAPRGGTIVFLRCNDDFCEAFLDYRIRAQKERDKQQK